MYFRMFLLCTAFFLYASVVSAVKSSTQEYSDISDYSFDQIYALLGRTIACLEDTPLLSPNGTFGVTLTIGFLHQAIAYIPHLHIERRSQIEAIEKRVEPFIINGLQAYPDDPGSTIWWSYFYPYTGNYIHEVGRVPTNQPLHKTFTEILSNSMQNDYASDCYKSALLDNLKSETHRDCTLKCAEEMTDLSYNSAVNPEDKAWYFGYIKTLNCTNFKSEELEEYIIHFCKHTKQEVDSMMAYSKTEQFKDTSYYFYKKVIYCASFGMPEFLSPKILSTVISHIDCNGCVGSYEDRQVMTALTTTVLAEALVLITEMEYGLVKF